MDEVKGTLSYRITKIVNEEPLRIWSAKEIADRVGDHQTVAIIHTYCTNLVREGYVERVPLKWGDRGRIGFRAVMGKGLYPNRSNLYRTLSQYRYR